ncbi:TonB-dependent receptor domain-containing protein [Flavobacterium sp.]|uniref:TonB-dependent receptor plug domain-containing protein n=1 Tax=Flavobacterium sp. TaxID=239 RepID=UPI00286D43BA|nr:TonB-dependent receptor [Flavobacterium sp.]
MQKHISILLILLSCTFFTYSQDTIQKVKLEEVKVQSKRKGLQKSYSVTANTTIITSKELLKAACCNLAESFETNPSIDVNFSDALTGTKQIKMLGLTSPYLMITEENIPSVRGASQAYGLSFTPGTWVESIQITKGAGSVVNGYESISGQINTELLKPISDIPFFLNAYSSSDSRFELNTHFNKRISDKWASSLFVHGNTRISKKDMNDDGFLDNPLAKQINILNRYQYYNADKGLVSFVNFRYMNDKKQTGEIDFDPNKDKGTTNFWGSEINTERFDVSTKIGYVFKDMPYQSIGFQNAFNSHNQNSYFGLNQYNIKQSSYYSNLIFNSIIDNTMHKFATGLNFTYDKYQEFVNVNDYSRIDNSVGAFFEYTYDNDDDFSVILGGRMDNHNRLGTFFTPRLHLRYNPWEQSVLRFSAGRGKRAANIFAENQQLFASSRTLNIFDTNGKIYGLNPEIAWNYGLSFNQKFLILGKKADVGFDFYRTDFQNQAVVDLMQSPQQVLFYNLKGISYANSLQVEFNYEFFTHFNLRSAYKYYDIQTDYLSGKFQRPLQAKHRFFGNLEYETHIVDKGKQWKFDYTFNWIGKQQLPNTATNPINDRLRGYSNSFSLMNAQITRTFSSTFEMYLGGENIGNYTQQKAILGSDNPFGATFDASIVYAPIFGQMYYAGLRFKIK